MRNLKQWSMMMFIFFAIACSKKEDTQNTPDGVPTLNTPAASDISNITTTTAVVNASVNLEGDAPVTAKGICWSTSHNPTISDNKTTNRRPQTQTVDKTQVLTFTATMTGLIPGTTYYVRVYATNDLGTGYSNEFSVTTIGTPGATVTDVDGNVYHTIQIGGQLWMLENLRTTHYNDSDEILHLPSTIQWANNGNAAYCYYENDVNNISLHGNLYNWEAVRSGRLAPEGWHVPADGDWQVLIDYIGRDSVAGGKMKSTNLWVAPNTGGTNSSGFTALPSGSRPRSGGDFRGMFTNAYFWSSTPKNQDSAFFRSLDYTSQLIFRYPGHKRSGYSVRCIKDL